MKCQDILNPKEMMASSPSSKELMGSTEKKDNECPVCQLGFATIGSMIRHKRSVHEKIKKWKCDICGKSYTSSQTLIDHKMKHSESDNKPWKCKEPGCIQAYAESQKLRLHRKKAHTKKEDMIQCGYCEKEFVFKTRLRHHQHQVHTVAEVGKETWHKIEQIWRNIQCKY